jgi:predicted adenine nucleotide alpha hydrolase (AANH) superfamily ATPase
MMREPMTSSQTFIDFVFTNYENILPEDEYMEELGENARVFKVYNLEAERKDSELVEGWKSCLDTMIIFVRLFTTFI